jgi:hypothetical protein
MAIGAAPATQPAEDVAKLQRENAQLRAEVADLRAIIADLRSRLAAPAQSPAAALAPKPKHAGFPMLEDYIRKNGVADDIAAKMRAFSPCVGMAEEELDVMMKAENSLAGNTIATRRETVENQDGKAYSYIFLRPEESGGIYFVRHQIILVNGTVTEVDDLGPFDDPAVVGPKLWKYFGVK